MEKIYKQFTVVNLTVIAALNLLVMAVYSFKTKQFFASDSFTFLLTMIDSNYFVDFYTDRQFVNYFTQFIPYFALNNFNPSYTTLQSLWGLNFICIPVIFLLIGLRNFSDSFKGLNLYLVCLNLFVIPMTTRWISEAVVCISLTLYIFSFYYKNKPNHFESLLVLFAAFILVKSYSTTAFSNIFLVFLVWKNTTQHLLYKIVTALLLIVGGGVGWKSILYPFFSLTTEDVSREVGFLFLSRVNETHLSIIGYLFIVIGILLKSKKVMSLSIITFTLQLLPSFWNGFLDLNGYRYLLSLPVLFTLIILWILKENKVNDKSLSLILIFGLTCSLPASIWRIENWRYSLSAYENFYKNESGKINIFYSSFRPNRKKSPFGWEALSYQLLFKKNKDLSLYYAGPEHEKWIQEDFERYERRLKEKGWRDNE